jgi:hypothetical protein
VIIDELASLTAYGIDRKIRAEIEQLLGLLLSQGRAVGVSVIAAVQDPAKDTLVLTGPSPSGMTCGVGSSSTGVKRTNRLR